MKKNWEKTVSRLLTGPTNSRNPSPHLPGEHHATMSAASPPIPQAGDEPVWVKDDDEDLEELVDLTGDAEIASSHQIDLQARLRPRAQFGGLG